MITHHGDINISESSTYIADNPYVKHWFAQNCLIKHPKITPIPIGLEDLYRQNAGYTLDFKKLMKNDSEKNVKIVMAFNIHTNKEKRQLCFNALKNNKYVEIFPQGLTYKRYRQELQKYIFVASPQGNGMDCHRTWETMHLKAIPIVEDNFMNRYFASLGLPMLCIKNWSDVSDLTSDQLVGIYEQANNKPNYEPLFFNYWKNKILEKKKE